MNEFDFDAALSSADHQLMTTFANVSVYIDGAETPVLGIFDAPSSIIKVPHGGQVQSADYTVCILSADATGIQRRTLLQIEQRDGSTQTFTVMNPDASDSSMSRFILKPYHANSQSEPVIQY
ncbi:hypothetical protein [Celerinatantimonas sp. MCCC 1A17872]|uniref:head-tail joining protein n=1 Tax=Celerinatantimonas sp. MCCC 1A17872 TaxID=3177514 RepID=UPI0038CAEADB